MCKTQYKTIDPEFSAALIDSCRLCDPKSFAAITWSSLSHDISNDDRLFAMSEACDVVSLDFPLHAKYLMMDCLSMAITVQSKYWEEFYRARITIVSATEDENSDDLAYKNGDLIDEQLRVMGGINGGMGEIYFCYDERRDRFCVAKFAKNQPDLFDYFNDESTAHLIISGHENIVNAYYASNIVEIPYFVTEFVIGENLGCSDLRTLMYRQPLSANQILNIALDICDGMNWVNSLLPGCVHRDLKPENIFINRDWVAMISDWGLVAANLPKEEDLMRVNIMSFDDESPLVMDVIMNKRKSLGFQSTACSPPYASPEQFSNSLCGITSDIYAFGCILYELFSGRPPFVCDSLNEYMHCHLYEMPHPIYPGLKSKNLIARLISKCLEKHSSKRPQSFEEVKGYLTEIAHIEFQHLMIARQERPKRLASSDYTTHIERILGLSKLGRHQIAKEMIDKVVQDFPDKNYGWFAKGIILNELSLNEEALTAYRQALMIEPDNVATLYNFGLNMLGLGEYKHDEGMIMLQKAAMLGHKKSEKTLKELEEKDSKKTIFLII